jgi:pilus assembly protein CpaE
MTDAATSDRALTVLALLRSAEAERDLKAAAKTVSGLRLETRQGALRDIGETVFNGGAPGIVLVDVRFDDPAEMAALERMMQQPHGDKDVIATSNAAPLTGVRQLMRMGIPDFLPQPISREDLVAALDAAGRRNRGERKSALRNRKIISFIKPCGGIGATSLAVQTACSIAAGERAKNGVALLDLDLQFGNVALYLDVDAHLNLFNIVDAPDRLDGSFLRGLMTRHDSGVNVLAGPQFVVPLDSMSPDLAVRLIDTASSEYDVVIVDLPQAWTLWSHAVLSHSSAIVFVTQFTVPGLRQGRRLLDTLRQEGLDSVPLITVINRYERSLFKREIGNKEAEKALGRAVDAFVDNDLKSLSQATNEGVPMSEVRGGEKIQKQIDELAALILDKVESADARAAVN